MTEQQPPANWYPDPDGGTGLRYWDGTQWTPYWEAGPSTAFYDPFAAGASLPSVSSAPTASEPVTATPASTPKPKRRGCLTVLALAVAIILVIVVIGVATTTSSKSSKLGARGSSATGKSTVESGLDHDAQVVLTTVAHVLKTLGLAETHPTAANINQLAQVAQQAHDALSNERDTMARDIDMSNSNQTKLYDALNGLNNSMNALVVYTGSPKPATLARFRTQYDVAVAEWNNAVTAIYADTGKALPTLPTA